MNLVDSIHFHYQMLNASVVFIVMACLFWFCRPTGKGFLGLGGAEYEALAVICAIAAIAFGIGGAI